MVARIEAILCLVALIFLQTEARWHNLKVLRKHRIQDSSNEDLSTMMDGDEAEEKYVRHSRLYPIVSTRDDNDNSDKSFEDESNSFQKSNDAEENDEYEDLKDLQRTPRHRFLSHHRGQNHAQIKRLHHHYHEKHRSSLDYAVDPLDLTKEETPDYEDLDVKDLLRNHARGKRHNHRRPWTEKDKKAFNNRPNAAHFDNDKLYEVEVREAQNSSLCNYTIVAIPDPGGRIPRELEHIKCNYVGSKCQDKGTYCCIQTYRNVQVMYESGKKETLKVYSGCVCSLQIYGILDPYIPEVDIDD